MSLRDGSAVRLRTVAVNDEPALRDFLAGVSSESLYRRFFHIPNPELAAALLAAGSSAESFALVAEPAGEFAIVAHAVWFRIDEHRAEAAFLVTDGWQGRGLGSLLFARLATAAHESGIDTLLADVLPGNDRMLAVFKRSGYAVETRPGRGAIQVRIALVDPAPELPLAA